MKTKVKELEDVALTKEVYAMSTPFKVTNVEVFTRNMKERYNIETHAHNDHVFLTMENANIWDNSEKCTSFYEDLENVLVFNPSLTAMFFRLTTAHLPDDKNSSNSVVRLLGSEYEFKVLLIGHVTTKEQIVTIRGGEYILAHIPIVRCMEYRKKLDVFQEKLACPLKICIDLSDVEYDPYVYMQHLLLPLPINEKQLDPVELFVMQEQYDKQYAHNVANSMSVFMQLFDAIKYGMMVDDAFYELTLNTNMY